MYPELIENLKLHYGVNIASYGIYGWRNRGNTDAHARGNEGDTPQPTWITVENSVMLKVTRVLQYD